jgi:hypothetical protein
MQLIDSMMVGLKNILGCKKELDLDFGDVSVKEKQYSIGGRDVTNQVYCIIIKKRGIGSIEKCEGKLRVEKIDSDYHPTVWHTSESRYVFIEMDRKDLRLFMILEFGDKKEIVFYIPIKNDEIKQYRIPYNEQTLDKKLSIKVGSKSAKIPFRCKEMKICQIIKSEATF